MSTLQDDGELMKFEGGVGVKTDWEEIQLELLMKIVSLLDDRTVIVASEVCRRWRHVICSELTHISLSWCTNNMNNLVLSFVPKLTKLRVLTLRKKEDLLLDDNTVETVANNCHALEDLDLSNNSQLGDRSLYALASGCPNLTKLNIRGCSGFSENGFAFLTSCFRKLKILNLSGCYMTVTNKLLRVIGDNCRQLESINIHMCYQVRDSGVMSLVYGSRSLHDVDLGHCYSITDKSVIALANNCLKLRSLNLDGCGMITDQAMYALAHSRVKSKNEVLRESGQARYEEEGLMNLNISRCMALTAPAVQALCDLFPALHTCSGRQSLIMQRCSKLTSVRCGCASQPYRVIRPV